MFNNKNENISIIYSSKNDSPKYIELNRKKFLFFIVVLPFITIVSLSLGFIGLISTSPFHLIQNYQKNNEAREAIKQTDLLKSNLQSALGENSVLKNEIEQLKASANTKTDSTTTNNQTPNACPTPTTVAQAPMATSIGLSTLSFFKPVQNQKDKTRPASLSLNDFKVVNNRENINFQFNINNLLGGDVKLAGHIVVLLKNDQVIEVYPMNAMNSPREAQINYASGEPFATQRFRPVIASFPKPKKGGNFIFTIYIFAKNGDLLHYQGVILPVAI